MDKVTSIFGENVFNETVMKARLPKETFKQLMKTIEDGEKLAPTVANVVANAMKDWAIEKGATHFTHWFQPLTGTTAEKHDSFITPSSEGKVIMEFSGKELVQGEPDASSFPSGGIRATFEARGYTAWDPTSYAFIKDDVLCIPTAFCSYTGEALDKKTPLLRSMEAISKQAVRVLHLFGNSDVTSVKTTVGPEQEYFLIDKEVYEKREDLLYTGRTLFGAKAPKGQELEDHYFGMIKPRVQAFMKDLNRELWKLGILAKTEHNEVAPGQHELAPIYETANIAVDHNQIIMETMKRVAEHHHMRCLLHEKPFAGVNGSGKHDNWSLCTDDGVNLLDPGDTPNKNVQFLFVLACVLKAVDKHSDLLRQSASDVGNDHRLGANEAPPAIISVFLGEQLEDVVRQLIETGEAKSSKRGGKLKTGVSTLPQFEKDATDRNRTSPFAFTGNKFEFRMVGSSDSMASSNTTLNTIVAEAFCEAADRLEKAGNFDEEVHDIIKEYLTEHQRIIFNGDGYSDAWVLEAKKRGLPNISSTIEAADTLTTKKAIDLFEKFGVYTKTELESRKEIIFETYAKTINIEALTMIDMASKQIIPAVMKYAGRLAKDVNEITNAGVDAKPQIDELKEIQDNLSKMKKALDKLKKYESKAASISDQRELAFFYKDEVRPIMDALRAPADELEMLVDKKDWPFPTYADLLFEG